MSATSSATQNSWPAGRGDRAEFEATYGKELADRFAIAFHNTDPVADALFAADYSVREIMPNLREVLATGEPTENTFPEVKALIDDMKVALDGTDIERYNRGREVYLSIPPLVHGLAVGPGSLIHTYSTPSIADILVKTGELTVGAVKRLAYTTNWTYSLYLPDGVNPGSKGFLHTGMVRAMHAHVRRIHERKGQDHSYWGAPINEFDMLRTWFDFTYIPYKGLREMGWTLTPEQEKDVFYLWKVVGRMVGIPYDLLEGLDDVESSQHMMDAIHAVDGEPNENTRALVDALMKGFVVNINGLTGLPEDSVADWSAAYARIIHGDEVADSQGVAKSLMLPIILSEIPSVTERYDLLRGNEEALRAEVAKNEQMLIDLLDEEVGYLKQDQGIAMSAAS